MSRVLVDSWQKYPNLYKIFVAFCILTELWLILFFDSLVFFPINKIKYIKHIYTQESYTHISTYKIMSFANRDSFTFSFSVWRHLLVYSPMYLFSYLLALAKTSSTIVYGSGTHGILVQYILVLGIKRFWF